MYQALIMYCLAIPCIKLIDKSLKNVFLVEKTGRGIVNIPESTVIS